MELIVRRNGKYSELIITRDRTVLESGLLDEKERRALAKQLTEAAEELLHGLDATATDEMTSP